MRPQSHCCKPPCRAPHLPWFRLQVVRMEGGALQPTGVREGFAAEQLGPKGCVPLPLPKHRKTVLSMGKRGEQRGVFHHQ